MIHKFTLLFVLCAIAMQSMLALDYNFATPQSASSRWGTEKKDIYDVAVLVKSPALVGMKVTGFSVPLDAPAASAAKAWLTSDLKLKKVSGVKHNDPDILTQDATVAGGILDVTFTEPYTITADGVYVGYSFEVTASDEAAAKQPVATYQAVNSEGFYLHTRRAYPSWEPVSEKLGCVLAINVRIDGTLASDAAAFKTLDQAYACLGEPVAVKADLRNCGTESVSSLCYHYAIGATRATANSVSASPCRPASICPT